MRFNWIVSQIGAREHYGVPRGFLHKEELRLLYTEVWCPTAHSLLKMGPGPMRSFAGRYHPEIPNSKVVSFNRQTLRSRLNRGLRHANMRAQYLYFIQFGEMFANLVADDLSKRELNPDEDFFFAFNTGALETMQMLRGKKILTVCDQIDPARVEEQIVYDEAERWPGWQSLPGRIPEEYWQRMDAEWAEASIVMVNSGWSKKALVKQGVPAEKIVAIAPTFEPEKSQLPARNNMDRPLTVLWLGLVNLRKGIQYLIEAARLLEHKSRVTILVAGPVLISPEVVAKSPGNMQFLGKIPRTETLPLYRKADVFILPTLSDGFAVSQLEAMSQGLPVITTPNCGEVVSHGIDGLVVPPFDPQALADAINKLDDDRNLLREMSYKALDKSAHFYLPRQVQRLEEAVANVRQGKSIEESRYQGLPGHSVVAAK